MPIDLASAFFEEKNQTTVSTPRGLYNIKFGLVMQVTKDKFRRGHEKDKDMSNIDINKEAMAKYPEFHKYSKGLSAS